MLKLKCYERVQIDVGDSTKEALLTDDGEEVIRLKPFVFQPVDITNDNEGIEHIKKSGKPCLKIRFTIKKEGRYTLSVIDKNGNKEITEIKAEGFANNGYVTVSSKDARYFSYSNGKKFFPIGINLTYPISYGASDGTEFGVTGEKKYIGLKQYESWIKKCSENGVNLIRLWVGHEYFSPDTENADEFKYEQFTKIDKIVDIAKKYNVKLKLTLDQFRRFVYENDDSNTAEVFKKKLYLDGVRCESSKEWLTSDKWKDAWLRKVEEFQKRYGGDTELFAIELWNEMNCVGEDFLSWNEDMLPRVKKLFPDNMVVNSLGSLDSEKNLDIYRNFCWNKCSFIQVHRYLDQGAKLENSTRNLIETVKCGIDYMKDKTKPIIIAETGAVNNCHSGPFKYYSVDDRGIIFVDAIFAPVFAGSAGSGNIWHWDGRYVESKNLYKYFKPLFDIFSDVEFDVQDFESVDLSDDDVYLLMLKGKSVSVGFIRNKSDNWENVLRDMGEPKTVLEKSFCFDGNFIKVYPIWENDSTSVKLENGKVILKNILYGTMFKIYG